MKTELENSIFTEKYRPTNLKELVFTDKPTLIKYLENPKKIPSFIFSSTSPGTGKTSTAKIISSYLKTDTLSINSSDERGIDTIRDKIKGYAQSLSYNAGVKKCIFLDEADGLTRQAQDSLRNLMETYSDNCFFILSCNDITKVIEPIRSRCKVFSFSHPSDTQIFDRFKEICVKEEIKLSDVSIENLVKQYYPDIRSCVKMLQSLKIEGKEVFDPLEEFKNMKNAIKKSDIDYIRGKVYSGTFDILGFNKYFFKLMYENIPKIGIEKVSKICMLLADIEKSWQLNINLEIVFLANILEIVKILK